MSSWEIQPVLLDTLTYQGFDTASSFDKLYNKFLFSWAQKSKKSTITFVKSGHVLCSRCLKKWSQGRFKMWQHDHYLFPSGIHVQKFTVTPDWCAGKGQHAGLRQNWTHVNMVEITKYILIYLFSSRSFAVYSSDWRAKSAETIGLGSDKDFPQPRSPLSFFPSCQWAEDGLWLLKYWPGHRQYEFMFCQGREPRGGCPCPRKGTIAHGSHKETPSRGWRQQLALHGCPLALQSSDLKQKTCQTVITLLMHFGAPQFCPAPLNLPAHVSSV